MSEYNIAVDSGASVRLKTAGKYCDRDIVVTASEGGSGGGDIDALIAGNLTDVESAAIYVKPYVFQGCSWLTSAKFPNVKNIGNYAFESCTRLANVELPIAKGIGTSAFRYCSSIRHVDLPSATSIGSTCFRSCSTLTGIILRAGAVATLGSSAFMSTPIASGTGYIYVPSALIDSYKAASGWSTYAAQFRALEDYTVDGTVTGALDESKI